MKKHLVISISWLERKLASFKNKDKRRLFCYDLLEMDYLELLEELALMKAQWFTVIHGNNCEHNPDGTCPWHE